MEKENIKTKVYVIRVLENDEYGDYGIYGIYKSKDKAEKELKKQGNELIKTWFNEEGIPLYYIEKWEVN